MIKKLRFTEYFLFALGILSSTLWGQVTTYNYTGALQTYTVPPGVTMIQLETWGAQGGGSKPCSGPLQEDGGLGGYAIGNLEVSPGDVLNIYVGGHPVPYEGAGTGPGGFNGGGDCGEWAGGGGGASDIRVGGLTLANRIIVAGGGGGGNTGCPEHGAGGNGGGLTGDAGTDGGGGYVPGGGGTPVAGGAGSGDGSAGALGVGGTGGYHVSGGGGGYYGGGAAYASGGGGGSSYLGGVTDGSTSSGLRTGHGQVVVTVLCNGLTVTVSDYSICLGDEVTLEAESGGGGEITWDGGVENGVPFTPGMVGFIDYTATSSNPDDCDAVVTIVVYALPTVTATADATLVCLGDEITLEGVGATSYTWEPDITDGEPFEPELGTTVYTVTGTSGPGCEGTDDITITVLETPEVGAIVSDDEICFGESVIFNGTGADIYVWSPDGVENGVAYTPDEAGTIWYYVTGSNSFGCSETDSVAVTMNEEIVVTYTTEDAITGADGSIDITVTGGTAPYTFDWDNDATGDFDDTEDLTGLTGGTYTVVVKDDNGCTTTVEIEVNSQAGIESNDKTILAVYPNPTTGFVVIEYAGAFNYEVTDISGAVVINANGTDKETLSLNNFASGVYFISIKNNQHIHTVKIVKR